MKVEKKDLEKSQIELNVELTYEEFEPYIKKGTAKVSKEVKIEGFRPGKASFDVLKQKIGEMTILEESARIAINATLGKVIEENVEGQPVGQPQVDITKIAPNNPLAYKVVLALLPKVTLGDYKTVKIKKKKIEVSEEEIKKTVDDLRDFKAKEVITESEAKDGDKLLVDINMFLDKVPIEGGQSKGVAVILGKNIVVPGFDKELVGLKKGGEKEFLLPYPKDYHMKNLANKMVEFKIKVKEVYKRELPEFNDELAKGFGFKNSEDFKNDVKKSLIGQQEKENARQQEKELLEELIKRMKFTDIPELLINHEADSMISELEQSVNSQGGKFDDYLQSSNKTREQIKLSMMPEAVKRVKVSLLLKEIAVVEKIEVEDEELIEYIKSMKIQYKEDAKISERLDSPEYKRYISNMLSSRKTIEKLLKWSLKD